MTETKTDVFNNGIGILASERGTISDIQETSPIEVNGIAIPENQVLQGGQGIKHYFSPEMAEKAARVLSDQIENNNDVVHLVKNFHDTEGQASADDVIGEVTSAGYSKGVGVVFEGEVSDEDIAQKIALGYLDISPSIMRSLGGLDETMQARMVDEVAGFRDIAVVARGQPGAGVEVGSNPAVEALSRNIDMDTGIDTYQLTSEQESLVEGALDDFVSSQGNATLRDLETWVYESGDLDTDVKVALEAAISEVFDAFDPDFSSFRIELFRDWLAATDTLENIGESIDTMSFDDALEEVAGEYDMDTDEVRDKLAQEEPSDDGLVTLIEAD